MPVEDLNAEKMVVEVMNTAEALELTTGFWAGNSNLPAAIVVAILIVTMFVGVFVFGWFLISKALKNLNR